MTRQEHYDRMIAAGEAPLLAEMLALQSPPGIGGGTERSFFEGKGHEPLRDMPEWQAKQVMDEANAAGVQTAGKVYKAALADKRGPGDPLAWVSDMHDVKKVCKLRNYNCTGAVTHVASELAPAKKVRLAPELVAQGVKAEILKEPGKKHDVRELAQRVIEKYGGKA